MTARTLTSSAIRSLTQFPCSALEPRRRSPQPWCSCYHRQQASSPVPASASTVALRTPSPGGGNCKRWNTTSLSTGSIVQRCRPSSMPTDRTGRIERTVMTPTVLYEQRREVAYITISRPELKNAIDIESHELMCDMWRVFGDDPALRVA